MWVVDTQAGIIDGSVSDAGGTTVFHFRSNN